MRLRAAFDSELPPEDAARLKIVAADNVDWGNNRSNYPNPRDGAICQACLDNATLRAAVGAIGTHYNWDDSHGMYRNPRSLR